MKHFAFQENFYDALCLLDERQGGQYVKAICDYMFEDKTPKLKPPVDSFFALAKRKLDLSKMRKQNGSRGGIAKQKHALEPPLDMDGFLHRQPQVKNDIYKSSLHLTEGVNWSLLNERLPQPFHSGYARSRVERIGKVSGITQKRRRQGAIPAAFGVPDWIRTNGLSLRRRPLYPTELRGHIELYFTLTALPVKNEGAKSGAKSPKTAKDQK